MKQNTNDLAARAQKLILKHKVARKKLGFYFREIDRRQIWKKLGYKSLAEYGEKEFGYAPEDIEEMFELSAGRQVKL